jgi:hypothetical protein
MAQAREYGEGRVVTLVHERLSFLFTNDGEEKARFSATTPPVLFHNPEKICVGEVTLDLTKEEYSVDANSSCTSGRFPALSGKVTRWGIWGI